MADRKLKEEVEGAVVGKTTLASSIFAELRKEILSGQIPPGTRIKTAAMTKRFNVGHSPVREAFNRLLSQGLVEQSERRGFSVSWVSEEELADITATRSWLHVVALRKSIELGDAEWEENILLRFHRMTRVPRFVREAGSESEAWNVVHRAFHMSLLSGCGSAWLERICGQLFEAAERYRYLGGPTPIDPAVADDQHRVIMQATVDRNADLAAKALLEHYDLAQEHTREALRSRLKHLG